MVTTVGLSAAEAATASAAPPADAGVSNDALAAQFEALLLGGATDAAPSLVASFTRTGSRSWTGTGHASVREGSADAETESATRRLNPAADAIQGLPLACVLVNLLPLATPADTRGPIDVAGGAGLPGGSAAEDVAGVEDEDGRGGWRPTTLGAIVSGAVSQRGGVSKGEDGIPDGAGLQPGDIAQMIAERLDHTGTGVDDAVAGSDRDGQTESPRAGQPAARAVSEHAADGAGRQADAPPTLAAPAPGGTTPAGLPRRGSVHAAGELEPVSVPKRAPGPSPATLLVSTDTSTPQVAYLGSPATVEAQTAPTELPVADQIVQAMRIQWRDGRGEATVTLHPEFLGNVSISLRVEQGGLTAVVRAEESQVREWIQANIGLLRERLQDQGLTLQKFEVSDGYQTPYEQPRENRGNSRPVTRQTRRQSRTTDTDQAFEVTA
jgi:hypothetical protein